MPKSSEHHVYFAVFGFGDDPEVITRAMGIAPTKTWSKGELISTSQQGKHTHSRWVLQSELPLTEPIEAHIGNLLARLELRREAVVDVCTRFDACMTIAAYLYEANPGFRLSADVVQRIAALGLEIDFDLYCLSGDADKIAKDD